jgi:hypothetical protein
MLFVPLVDSLLFQNPLATAVPDWATSLPGHHATAALFDAAFTSGVTRTTALGAAGYAAILLAASDLVFSRATGVR